MDTLTHDQLKSKTNDELVAHNQSLMEQKDAITMQQQKVKSELNSRAALAKFHAMPDAEKQAIVQHINAGNLNPVSR
jgi:hypothetical protein